jgi:hypothetical protein
MIESLLHSLPSNTVAWKTTKEDLEANPVCGGKSQNQKLSYRTCHLCVFIVAQFKIYDFTQLSTGAPAEIYFRQAS